MNDFRLKVHVNYEVIAIKIMKPIASVDFPDDLTNFLYEIKYDGFRAFIVWQQHKVQIFSRNNIDLTSGFPEIITACEKLTDKIVAFLPATLDGELVVLNNDFEANFACMQWRGRIKNTDKIRAAATSRPATFLAFDILAQNNESMTGEPLVKRKKALHSFFDSIGNSYNQLRMIQPSQSIDFIRKKTDTYRGEGIVAKRKNSTYQDGKQHHDWFKIKNWRIIRCFLTMYNPSNGYFTACVFHHEEIVHVGKCKHGLTNEEQRLLTKIFVDQGHQTTDGYELPPAICAEIQTLDIYNEELREPRFVRLLPNVHHKECTYKQMQIDLAMMPKSVSLSNIDKVFWPDHSFTKGDLLIYMRLIYPYMEPFLHDRALTVIRSPDGVHKESFYQKTLPEYAPAFMSKVNSGTIICNDLDAFIWLVNHGAVEYHIPFQLIQQEHPSEIVFDLDPPGRELFDVAIEAALLIKHLIDPLELTSFVKTSGNKGLQIHIPIPPASMTYDETAIFTEAIATTLVQEYPHMFTIERLKKKRNNKLYIDYVQHGKGKTIIAPYSPRKTADATVATPLFWHELTEKLTPQLFTIKNVVDRVNQLGCPFANYEAIGKSQNMVHILQLIRT